MAKSFPKHITSYDLLKTFAVVTMIIDHIGVYFFPEEMWWRAFGRLSAPCWLFLIGYARSRDLSPRLWQGAMVLLIANFFIAPTYFPANILIGMLLVRWILDKAATYMFSEYARLAAGIIIMALAFFPTNMLVDYGSFCLLFALFGYAVRHAGETKTLSEGGVQVFAAIIGTLYFLTAFVGFGFSQDQAMVIMGSLLLLFILLYKFRAAELSALTECLPATATAMLKFCGRRSLEIYVGHLLLFKALAWALGIEGFGLFEWDWF